MVRGRYDGGSQAARARARARRFEAPAFCACNYFLPDAYSRPKHSSYYFDQIKSVIFSIEFHAERFSSVFSLRTVETRIRRENIRRRAVLTAQG